MAGERIFGCRYFKHPTTAVNAVTHFGLAVQTVKKRDVALAGVLGPSSSSMTFADIQLTVYGPDFQALLALVNAAAANSVLGTVGASGANEKMTVKNVLFDSVPQAAQVPMLDQPGGPAMFAVTGTAQWSTAGTDTLATMITQAADA